MHYFAQNFYAPVALSPYIDAGNVTVYVVNDNLSQTVGSIVLDLLNWKNGPVATWTAPVTVTAATAAQVGGAVARAHPVALPSWNHALVVVVIAVAQ